MEDQKPLVYNRAQSNADIWRYVKAVALPVFVFLLNIFTIDHFKLFGLNIIAPLSGLMWLTGAVVAIAQPSLRHSVIKETMVTIGAYLPALLLFKLLVAKVSGVSSEMLMATYNQAIPVTSGEAFSGYMQTMLWITAIMTPVGFIGMQIKKLFTMRRTKDAKRTRDQLLGTRPIGKNFD